MDTPEYSTIPGFSKYVVVAIPHEKHTDLFVHNLRTGREVKQQQQVTMGVYIINDQGQRHRLSSSRLLHDLFPDLPPLLYPPRPLSQRTLDIRSGKLKGYLDPHGNFIDIGHIDDSGKWIWHFPLPADF